MCVTYEIGLMSIASKQDASVSKGITGAVVQAHKMRSQIETAVFLNKLKN